MDRIRWKPACPLFRGRPLSELSVTLGLGVKQPRFSAGLVLSDTGGRWGGSDERVDIVKRLSESWFHL